MKCHFQRIFIKHLPCSKHQWIQAKELVSKTRSHRLEFPLDTHWLGRVTRPEHPRKSLRLQISEQRQKKKLMIILSIKYDSLSVPSHQSLTITLTSKCCCCIHSEAAGPGPASGRPEFRSDLSYVTEPVCLIWKMGTITAPNDDIIVKHWAPCSTQRKHYRNDSC